MDRNVDPRQQVEAVLGIIIAFLISGTLGLFTEVPVSTGVSIGVIGGAIASWFLNKL